jgi:glycogen operon protein
VRWTEWPAALRVPDGGGIATFRDTHARALHFALYLQWCADEQLGEAARGARAAGLALGFYRDLAVGAAPDGAEAWSMQDALALDVSIGAPPDPFARDGQVWHLPPLRPEALAANAYAAFRGLLRANMRHAGALRIDHVMGLARQFWIPAGAPASAGAYVRYPLHDLLGTLAFESAHARCLIVGEDLGTVPDGLRTVLEAARVLSYRLLWFERDGAAFRPPSRYPALAAACVSTHDLPTVAGWWNGIDLDEAQALGRRAEAGLESARATRATDRVALAAALTDAGVASGVDAQQPHAPAVTQAVHAFIGQSNAALALIQADDLADEPIALNLPGTDRERPNWRRKVGIHAAQLWDTPNGRHAAAAFAPARGRQDGDGQE